MKARPSAFLDIRVDNHQYRRQQHGVSEGISRQSSGISALRLSLLRTTDAVRNNLDTIVTEESIEFYD